MIVLDTQAWIWWLHDPSRLSRSARTAIEAGERAGSLKVSAISVWEIAVKVAMGKLSLPMEIGEWYRRASSYPGLDVESVGPADAIASTQLPGDFHRDPADRIVVALARRYGAPLVTSDRLIRDYPHVTAIW